MQESKVSSDNEDEEDSCKFDVQKYIGQSLIKNNNNHCDGIDFLKLKARSWLHTVFNEFNFPLHFYSFHLPTQSKLLRCEVSIIENDLSCLYVCRLLTGLPLIKISGSEYPASGASYFKALHQHQLNCYQIYYQSLGANHGSTPANNKDPSANFLPRVLKPRRRKHNKAHLASAEKTDHLKSPRASDGGGGEASSYSSNTSGVHFEIGLEDEMRFLPTDLLDENVHDVVEAKAKNLLPPITRPRKPSSPSLGGGGGDHAKLKQTESFNFKSPNAEQTNLRKTFSWTNNCGDGLYQSSSNSASFSLFPKSSDSDLLSNVRNNLGKLSENKNITTNLEEALNNLKIGRNEISISRKF